MKEETILQSSMHTTECTVIEIGGSKQDRHLLAFN